MRMTVVAVEVHKPLFSVSKSGATRNVYDLDRPDAEVIRCSSFRVCALWAGSRASRIPTAAVGLGWGAPLWPKPATPAPASVGDVPSSVAQVATTTTTTNATVPGPEGIVVSMASEPSAQSTPMVAVSIPSELAQASGGFRFVLPEGLVDAAGAPAISVRTAAGAPLPSWLRYVPESGAFVASAVPDGGLPINL